MASTDATAPRPARARHARWHGVRLIRTHADSAAHTRALRHEADHLTAMDQCAATRQRQLAGAVLAPR